MAAFHVKSHQAHLKWDNSLEPVLTVESGSEVLFELKDGGNNQFGKDVSCFHVCVSYVIIWSVRSGSV